MNEALQALGMNLVLWKLTIALTISLPITSEFFLTNAQWSETYLLNTYCLEPDQYISHSSDTRALSNLLLATPLGLYHVYFLSTTGISFKEHLSINSLNLAILQLLTVPLFLHFLSNTFLTALKSPITHLIKQLAFSNLSSISLHNITFSFIRTRGIYIHDKDLHIRIRRTIFIVHSKKNIPFPFLNRDTLKHFVIPHSQYTLSFSINPSMNPTNIITSPKTKTIRSIQTD